MAAAGKFSFAGLIRLCSMSLLYLSLLIFTFPATNALYEDQVGKFDWRLQNVGCVQNAFFDRSGQKPSQIFVQTDENVIAALSVATGSILWRKVLEEIATEGPIRSVLDLPTGSDVIVASSQHVRKFHLAGGFIAWDYKLPQLAESDRVTAVDYGDIIAVVTPTAVIALNTKTGADLWQVAIPQDEAFDYGSLASVSDETLFLVGLSPSSVSVSSVNEEVLAQNPSIVPSHFVSSPDCVMSGRYLLCYNGVGSQSMSCLDVAKATDGFKRLDQVVGSEPVVSVLREHTFAVKDGDVTIIYGLEAGALVKKATVEGVVGIGRSSAEEFLFTVIHHAKDSLKISALSLPNFEANSQFSTTVTVSVSSSLAMIVPHVLVTRDGQVTFKMLGIFDDCSAVMFKQDAFPAWRREEALSRVVAMEMVDLPVSDAQAAMEEEFGAAKGNIVSQFISRVISQLAQLYSFGLHLYVKVTTTSSLSALVQGHRSSSTATPGMVMNVASDEDEGYMTRDSFNLHKMIVVATASGKLFGLDSYTGQIVWSRYLENIKTFDRGDFLLFVQRTTAHFPFDPVTTVLGRSKTSATTTLAYSFNPITGEPSFSPSFNGGRQETVLPFPVLQATLASFADKQFLHPLVLLGPYQQASLYPDSVLFAEADPSHKTQFMYTLDPETARMEGYKISQLTAQSPTVTNTWTTLLGGETPQRVLTAQPKHPAELVHSQGRVMADRSVLYKHLNPNLIAIITEETEEVGGKMKGSLNVYLVDGVSGKVTFQCSHKQASGPVTLVHSENWVVYTYMNDRLWRSELAVLDLYDGAEQSNSTAFTSLSGQGHPLQPIVSRSGFILGLSLTASGVTLTEMGITRKNLLFARTSGGIVEIPKSIVDARRPAVPTPESQEEGLPPYAPELPFSHEAAINYNQTLGRGASRLYTSPTGLESTSLVLATGLDLFFTKTAPSSTYDLLKDDFDFIFISLVLGAMVVATIVFKSLAQRKALQKVWK